MNSLTLIEKGRKLTLEIWNKAHDGKSITRAEINAFVTLRMMQAYGSEKKARDLAVQEGLTGLKFSQDYGVVTTKADYHALMEVWNVLGRPFQIYVNHVREALEPKPLRKRERRRDD